MKKRLSTYEGTLAIHVKCNDTASLALDFLGDIGHLVEKDSLIFQAHEKKYENVVIVTTPEQLMTRNGLQQALL